MRRPLSALTSCCALPLRPLLERRIRSFIYLRDVFSGSCHWVSVGLIGSTDAGRTREEVVDDNQGVQFNAEISVHERVQPERAITMRSPCVTCNKSPCLCARSRTQHCAGSTLASRRPDCCSSRLAHPSYVRFSSCSRSTNITLPRQLHRALRLFEHGGPGLDKSRAEALVLARLDPATTSHLRCSGLEARYSTSFC